MKKGFLKDYVLDPDRPGGYRYVGTYYSCRIPDKTRRKHGILQIIGSIAEMLFVLLAVSIHCLGNFKISVVIPVECMLICIVLYLTGSYNYMMSPDRMEKGTYEKAFLRTVQSVAVGLVLNVFSFIAQTVVVIKNMSVLEGYGDYLLLGMLAVLIVCNFAVLKYQRGLYKQAGPVSVEAEIGGNPD